MKEFPVLLGVHKYDAFRILADFGHPYRIAEEDGKHYRMVDGFIGTRVNLSIKDGIVFDYKFY
jgi:hypothetical protein